MQLASGKERMKVFDFTKNVSLYNIPYFIQKAVLSARLQDHKLDALVLCNKQKMTAERRVFLGKSIKLCVLLTI